MYLSFLHEVFLFQLYKSMTQKLQLFTMTSIIRFITVLHLKSDIQVTRGTENICLLKFLRKFYMVIT